MGETAQEAFQHLRQTPLMSLAIALVAGFLASKTVAQTKRRIFVFYFIVGILGSFLGQFAILYFGIDEILDKIADFRPFFDLLAAYIGSFVLVTMVHFIKPA